MSDARASSRSLRSRPWWFTTVAAAAFWLVLGGVQWLLAWRSGLLGGVAPGDAVTDVLAWQSWARGAWPVFGHFSMAGPPHPGPAYVALVFGPSEWFIALTGAEPYAVLLAWQVVLSALAVAVASAALVRATGRAVAPVLLVLVLLPLAFWPQTVLAVSQDVGAFLFWSSLVSVTSLAAAVSGSRWFALPAALGAVLLMHAYVAFVPLGLLLLVWSVVAASSLRSRVAVSAVAVLGVFPLMVRFVVAPQSWWAFTRVDPAADLVWDERTGSVFPQSAFPLAGATPGTSASWLCGLLAVTVLALWLWRARGRSASWRPAVAAAVAAALPLVGVAAGSLGRPWAWSPLLACALTAVVCAALSVYRGPREFSAPSGSSPRSFAWLPRGLPAGLALGLALLLLLGAAVSLSRVSALRPGLSAAPGLVDVVSRSAPQGGGAVVLAFGPPSGDTYVSATSLLSLAVEAHRRGVRVCLLPAFDPPRPLMVRLASMSGAAVWCDEADLVSASSGFTLLASAPPDASVVYRTPAGSLVDVVVVAGVDPSLRPLRAFG